jgi:hypothetical protein
MKRTKWIEREFALGNSPGLMPNILERLRGTPVRLRHICKDLKQDDLEFKHGDAWSIKEHVGHLSDLEDLHEGRIDDFIERKNPLRAADMSNDATYKANHNKENLDHLLRVFETKRQTLVKRLMRLDEDTQNYSSMHPRLKQMMRPVDMAFFTAEHDDQHLAIIREILTRIGK